MAKKKLGKKYACYQCGCKFYDLNRPQPNCPKCGADQNNAPKKEPIGMTKGGTTAPPPARIRPRRRREEEVLAEPGESFPEDELEPAAPLEDGLSMIDDDELIGAEPDEYREED